MSNIDRRQLRHFIAVAEELHFGNAARRLHMSQPPLSQSIAALEYDLGAQLFLRTKRKVELTAAGHQFLKDARAILDDMQKAAHRARAAAEGKTGILRIGLNYTAPLNSAVGDLFRRFTRLYPQVQLELHENASAKQLDRLYHGLLDLCFIWPVRGEATPDIAVEPVSNDRLSIVMGGDHPLAKRKIIGAKDLKDYPIHLTLRQTRTEFFDALMAACHKAGFEPDIRTDIIQMPFILNVATAGTGIAFLPQFLSKLRLDYVLFRNCQFLPVSLCSLPLSVVYRARDTAPAVRNFTALVKERNA